MSKKLHIKTFGCQMNVYDSDRMADVLEPLGYVTTDQADEADMVLVNTCHIREKAAEKLFSELGRYRQHKEMRAAEGRDTLIAVAGCVAQAEGAEIIRRAPFVDIVLGPQTYHRLPEMIAQAARVRDGKEGRENRGVLDIEFPEEPKFDHLPPVRAEGYSAFLSVQEGCDKFCTFCVVPYTRGAEFSRPVDAVAEEARQLADAGVREITLLGQNVNAYHGAASRGGDAEVRLGGLVRRLAEIDGLDLIRYTTSHPIDMDDDLIAAHGEVDKLAPFLHLPVQSGSDRILARMNRRHTSETYFEIVEKLLAAQPKVKLSSDFIVGFSGESDADFEQTLKLVRQVGFIQAYSFKYSPRPGTPGATMDDQVPEEVKSERLARLQALLEEQQRDFNLSSIGETMSVLLDRRGRKPGQLAGRSPYMQAVHVFAPDYLLGQMTALTLTEAHTNSLAAVMAAPNEAADSARELSV